ncbi:MAG: LysR family transcriptional regulator [Lachnospiraceae bacterium]|nr:LysR family transcriptional regulator [Lachnospiraceae bacterium]
MNINYEYYRIFYYVAKYKNLTQAAEMLHNNQPNISRTMKQMEEEMGCKLLVRSNRGISLTPEGEQVYSHVKLAVEHLQAAEGEIMRSTGMMSGSVSIGASETALRMVMLPVLNHFKKLYPDIHIRIQNHLTSQSMEAVRKELVDFAVVVTPEIIEKPLVSYPIIEFHDILIGGSDYIKLKDKPLSLNELNSYPLVCLGDNTVTYHFYEELFHRYKLELKPELEAATTDQILPMVKHNLGLGFIPDVYAREALEKSEVFQIPVAEKIPSRRICFVENKNHMLSIAAKELKELIMECRVSIP